MAPLTSFQPRRLIVVALFGCLLTLVPKNCSASCTVGPEASPGSAAKADDEANYNPQCIEAIKGQIKMEFEAALQYLLMGAYFDQDNVNLKGFSKLFLEHADEERQHGIQFINYVNMRGGPNLDFFNLFDGLIPILGKDTWTDGGEALRDALAMEKKVSGSIHGLIKKCEEVVDFHAADWLTSTWLPEQLEGQRKLAGLINNLDKFRLGHEPLADWIFSNQLLEEEA